MKFDATVNVSTVLAIVGMIGTGAVSYASAETRISKNEERINAIAAELARQRAETREDLREIRDDQKLILNVIRGQTK